MWKSRLLAAALALSPVAANAACISGSGIQPCEGWNEVSLLPAPYTAGNYFTLALTGDGKTTQSIVGFSLPQFTSVFSPQCMFGPEVGGTEWPGAGPVVSGPEFQGWGSAVVGTQRVAYVKFNLATPIGYGVTVFETGLCH